MTTVMIYTTRWCSYCTGAKKLLDSKEVEYTEIDVSTPDERAKMTSLTGGRTVPQLLINEQATGGCDELYALDRSGELDKLLNH